MLLVLDNAEQLLADGEAVRLLNGVQAGAPEVMLLATPRVRPGSTVLERRCRPWSASIARRAWHLFRRRWAAPHRRILLPNDGGMAPYSDHQGPQ